MDYHMQFLKFLSLLQKHGLSSEIFGIYFPSQKMWTIICNLWNLIPKIWTTIRNLWNFIPFSENVDYHKQFLKFLSFLQKLELLYAFFEIFSLLKKLGLLYAFSVISFQKRGL